MAGQNPFELGVAVDWRNIKLDSGAIPDSVKQEAQDPSIVNPYSGHYFGKETIGTYSPDDTFRMLETGLYGQYTFGSGSALKPYLRGEFQYPFMASTHEGEYGHGYTYDRVLGSGSDYVRYTYGIKYEYAYFFEPEAGLRYDFDDSSSVYLGVSFQRLELTYYKGIEAWGNTEHLYKLGSSKHDLINYKVRFMDALSRNISLYLEPSYTKGDGLEGWGVGLFMYVMY